MFALQPRHSTGPGAGRAPRGAPPAPAREAPNALWRRLATRAPAVLPKLAVGAAHDPLEREADRVADAVMRGAPAAVTPAAPSVSRLQRCSCGGGGEKCAACRAEEEQALQRAASGEGALAVAPPLVHDILASPGEPLGREARAFLEPRFGRGFGDVRVHTDARAAESARAVGAVAYTVGSHLVFGTGAYRPGSPDGRRLLAHELTHVVQQGGAEAPAKPALGTGPTDDAREREAGGGGGNAPGQGAEVVGVSAAAPAQVQREEETNPSVPASARAPGAGSPSAGGATAEITLETGNIGAGFLNNLVHQQICVDGYGSGTAPKRCFSFAASGVQAPQFSTTWLGWNSWVTGSILQGEVYAPAPVPSATVVSRHTPTPAEGARWLSYMTGTRLGLKDGYSVGRHNCRMFSQQEFADAPSHW